MNIIKKRTILLLISISLTFIFYRTYLYWNPHSNLYIAGYNIHHLYIGIMLITLGGLPCVLYNKYNLFTNFSTIIFGVGLASALDQIVYLITTDGSDFSYLLPISFIGGLIAIILTLFYIIFLYVMKNRN